MLDRNKIDSSWSKCSENYSWIIDTELESYRPDKWCEKILTNITGNTPRKILDLGCGPGFFSIILSKKGHDVTGIDGSKEMLKEAEEKAKRFGVTPQFKIMDCHFLNFEDETFDLVVSRNVTHTLIEHKTAYKEWLRVLKPGGVLLIFDANWHLSRINVKMQEDNMRRRQECIAKYGDAFDKKTTHEQTEKESSKHILGDKFRPDWDMGLLEGIGFVNISTERNIIEEMWDEKEILLYGNTPMFMIRAEKRK